MPKKTIEEKYARAEKLIKSDKWKSWCHAVGIKPTLQPALGEEPDYGNLKGRNRYFRINASGEFDCSQPLELFDRWANSTGITIRFLPASFKEFKNVIEFMLANSELATWAKERSYATRAEVNNTRETQ